MPEVPPVMKRVFALSFMIGFLCWSQLAW